MPLALLNHSVELSADSDQIDYYKSIVQASENGNAGFLCLLLNRATSSKLEFDPSVAVAAMMSAIQGRHSDCVKLLLNCKTFEIGDIAENNCGWKAITYATSLGYSEIVIFLLQHAFDGSIMPVLMKAVMTGLFDTVRLLLTCEMVDVNESFGDRRETALHLATDLGNTLIAELLINHPNVDINQSDCQGEVCLMRAISQRRLNIFQLLLNRNNLDVNRPNKNGITPLIRTAYYNKNVYLEMAQYLMEHSNIQVNLCNRKGQTFLIVASSHGNIDAIELALRHVDVNVNDRDNSGWCAVMHLASNDLVSCLKLLLEHPETNVDLSDHDGITALMLAVESNNAECVRELLNRGADAELKDKNGFSAIDRARRLDNHNQIVLQSLLASKEPSVSYILK